MIPLDVLRRVMHVYSHKNCPDGMATAIILKDAFRMLGTKPKIEFLTHNTPEHKAAGQLKASGDCSELVLFCDICPHSNVLAALGEHPRWAVVLDHHKGAEETVRSFGELGVFADEKLEPGVSGAVLAWREVWAPIHEETSKGRPIELVHHEYMQVMNFARDVGARDTWQTESSRFRQGQYGSKMLMSKPASYWLCESALPYLTPEDLAVGRALFEAHEEAVRQAVDQCVILEMPEGQEKCVLLYVFQEQASGFRLTSDVAEAIRSGDNNGPGVVAGFLYVVEKPGEDPELNYSLRGLNGFDVSAFAKANGGGGHTLAARFSTPTRLRSGGVVLADPYEEIRRRLETFVCGP